MIKLIILVFMLVFESSMAIAVPINPRPVSIGSGFNSNEPSLQDILDEEMGDGTLNARDDQSGEALFQPQLNRYLAKCLEPASDPFCSGGYRGDIYFFFLAEETALGSYTEFGIYDAADSTKKAVIFGKDQTSGDQAILSYFGWPNDYYVGNWATSTSSDFDNGWSQYFGFYIDVFGYDSNLETLDYTLYSQDSLNPGGKAQALIYESEITDETALIIAFEDLRLTGFSDGDYQDFVFGAVQIGLVPEPSTLFLLVFGLWFVVLRYSRQVKLAS